MAGFVKSMVPWMSRFVQERRLRCAPQDEDAASYGRRAPLRALPATDDGAATTPLVRSGSLASSRGGGSSASNTSLADSAYAGSEDGSSVDTGRVQRSASMRRLGLAMVASGVAYAIARTASGSALGVGAPAPASAGANSAGGGGKAASGGSGHHHKRRHGSGKHRQRSQRPPRSPVPLDA